MQGTVQCGGHHVGKMQQFFIHLLWRYHQIFCQRDERIRCLLFSQRFFQHRINAGDRCHTDGQYRNVQSLRIDAPTVVTDAATRLQSGIAELDHTIDPLQMTGSQSIDDDDQIRSVTLCDLFDDHAALQPGLPHHTRSQHRNIARSFQPVRFFLLIKVCRHQQLGCHLRTQRIADDLTIAQPDDEHAFDRTFCRIHEQSEMVQQRIDQFRSLKPVMQRSK